MWHYYRLFCADNTGHVYRYFGEWEEHYDEFAYLLQGDELAAHLLAQRLEGEDVG